MPKLKLIFDCDNTLINSTKAFIDCFNILYKDYPNFVEADWIKCNKYDFSDVAPLQVGHTRDIFSNKLFFDLVEPFDNTVEVLKLLSKQFDIYLCTIGNVKNIQLKLSYIEKTFPFIENILPIINKDCEMEKSMINMKNCIFIDDVASNLLSSNASVRMCYGDIKSWNIEWKGKRCADMLDMYNQLIYILRGSNGLFKDILNHNILATYKNKLNK